MAYTQKRFINDEAEFPTPPLWLVWNADITYDQVSYDRTQGGYRYTGLSTKDTGQVRHQPTLEKAKKNVHLTGTRGAKTFFSDWAIYRWEGEKYVLKYSGVQGEPTASHPLWNKGVAKDGVIGAPRNTLQTEIDEALASIAQVSTVRKAAASHGIAL